MMKKCLTQQLQNLYSSQIIALIKSSGYVLAYSSVSQTWFCEGVSGFCETKMCNGGKVLLVVQNLHKCK
jgi:hypothetical protein